MRENGREYAVNVAMRERKRERVLERERKERVFIDGETNNTLWLRRWVWFGFLGWDLGTLDLGLTTLVN